MRPSRPMTSMPNPTVPWVYPDLTLRMKPCAHSSAFDCGLAPTMSEKSRLK
ncbi:hypothetical protein D3C85_1052250 [compost metagenome]